MRCVLAPTKFAIIIIRKAGILCEEYENQFRRRDLLVSGYWDWICFEGMGGVGLVGNCVGTLLASHTGVLGGADTAYAGE